MENKIKSGLKFAGLCACAVILIAIIWFVTGKTLPEGAHPLIDGDTRLAGSRDVVDVNVPANRGQAMPRPVVNTGTLTLTSTTTSTPTPTRTNTLRPARTSTSTLTTTARMSQRLGRGIRAPAATLTAEALFSITPTPPINGPITMSLTSVSLPDLRITDVHVYFMDTYVGSCPPKNTQTNLAQVEVSNAGDTDAGPFVLRLAGSDTLVGGLKARTRALLEIPAWGVWGPVIIDATDLVTESNEGNNIYSEEVIMRTAPVSCTPTITLTGTLPDLVIEEVRVSFGFNYSGACALYDSMTKTVSVTIVNNEQGDAGPFVLRAGDADIPISGLRGWRGTVISTEFEWNLIVDVYNQVAESDENNNHYYGPVFEPTPPIFCTATQQP